jgi:hypothetical protein
MRKHMRHKASGLLVAALFAGILGACVDLSAPEENPNTVGTASLNQLLTTAQVNSFFYNESEVPRMAMLWTQQLLGADRQFATLELFDYGETDGEDNWSLLYRQGGLTDIRQGLALAEEQGNSVAAGILKIHEAYIVGMAASWWGDIPYSEAVNPEITEPALDGQLAVYSAVQSLLDDAIADLQSGSGFVGDADMNFSGEASRWIAVAHSLKARFYMHVAQAEGASAYTAALNSAMDGIMDPANNWVAIHTSTATENNLWYMFQRDRSGYILADPDMVTMLEDRADPRRAIYFTEDGENINEPATAGFDQPIVSCSETYGIMAEASYELGNIPDARDYLQAMVDDCQEPYWSGITDGTVDIAVDASAIAEADLLTEIMTEKYIAQFLNPDVWTDYRRTCLPDVPTPGNAVVPEALYYPDAERQTNQNIPQSPPATYTGLQMDIFPDYPGICG